MLFLTIAFCIFLWLRTHLFIDIISYFFYHWNLFWCIDYSRFGNVLEYPLWLHSQKFPNKFIPKLLACPLCLSFWTNLIVFFSDFVNICSGTFLTLVSFCVLDKLYKHGK